MSRRRRRSSRRPGSVGIRHQIGLVILGIVYLFMLQLLVSFLREGDWRGTLFTLLAGIGLGVVTFYSGRRKS